MAEGKCWSCGALLEQHEYGRETVCLKCGKPTHVCKNCRNYAPGRPHDCIETSAEPVKEKERANYCEFFEPTCDVEGRGGGDPDEQRKAAEALFKF